MTKKKCNCDVVCETLVCIVEDLNYLIEEGRLQKCGEESTSIGSGDSESSSDHL